MTIEDIARRFRSDNKPEDEPPDHERIRDARKRRSNTALTALRNDKEISFRKRQPEPTEHERHQNFNKWLAAGIGAGAVGAIAAGVAVAHHHLREEVEADDTDDEASV